MWRTFFFAIALTTAVTFPVVHSAEPSLPEAGPLNGGLRLRLIVTNQMNPNVHDLRLDVVNASGRDVTLVATNSNGLEPGETYHDILRKSIVFTSTPEIIPSYFQTVGSERKSAPPNAMIREGRCLTIEWTEKGKSLSSYYTNQGLDFPRKGLFLLRAHAVVKTDTGREVKLWSNEQPYLVGGSHQAPAACIAEITRSDEKAATATIDIGELDGVKKNDLFAVQVGLQGHWRLQVTEVNRNFATARISPRFRRGRVPSFPTAGTKAAYQPAARP